MDNPVKLETLGTINTRRRQTKQRHKTKTNKTKTQDEDKQNTDTRRRQTKQRHKTKTNKIQTQQNVCCTPLYMQNSFFYIFYSFSYILRTYFISFVGDNPEEIQKQNEELRDLYTCKICLDEKVGITFVPCGHLVTCKNCSPKIRKCPLCRTFIRGTIKTTI